MSKVVYEVCAKTGTYTDSQGQEKNRWQKCGIVLQGDKGLSLKLEAVPVGEWNGWFSLFEPKPRDDEQPRQQRQAAPARQSPQRSAPAADFSDMDDDIPF